MIVMGCDPGVTGALAFLDSDAHRLLAVYDMPTFVDENGHRLVDFLALVAIVERHSPDKAMTEEPWGFKANATFAVSYGTLLGAFQYMRRPPLLRVHPTVWQKALLADLMVHNGPDTKASSRAYAERACFNQAHWPARMLYRGRGRRPDHNRCDAVCIAHYAATCPNG